MYSSDYIADLLFRHLRGQLTSYEVKELISWRLADPANEQLFQEVNDEETLLKKLRQYHRDKEEVWHNIIERRPELKASVTKKSWWKRPLAAAIVIAIFTGTLYWVLNPKTTKINETAIVTKVVKPSIPAGTNKAVLTLANGTTQILDNNSRIIISQGTTKIMQPDSGILKYVVNSETKLATAGLNTLITPKGGQYRVILPDGSQVWLNAASSLSYPVQFNGEERKVELSGEAYFEVVKNPDLPFKVLINRKVEVTVLGTHFNIQSYTDEPVIATTLLEGSVRFQNLVLKPGEQGQLQKNGLLVVDKNVDVANVIAWKNGMIRFSNTDIPTIMRFIERWYDVEVHYAGKISTKRLTGGISRGVPLSEILKVLKMYDIHTTLENNQITVLP